jgi:hypothetical protein
VENTLGLKFELKLELELEVELELEFNTKIELFAFYSIVKFKYPSKSFSKNTKEVIVNGEFNHKVITL